jgi:hypothetical protein
LFFVLKSIDHGVEARRKAQDEKFAQIEARCQAEEAPILADLAAVGWNIRSVWRLVDGSARGDAIPVLLKHLLLPYSDRIREGIARALAVRQARYAWPTLVEEYRKAPIGRGIRGPGETEEFRLTTKDGLACAVAAAATEDVMDDLVVLAKDRTLGQSRVLLLSALKKSKAKIAKEALKELASDPDLTREISSWKR